tara:strand:- start:153 stop:323 length:171 start_codon:yes stop_codon:yes gene_type:complete
MYVQLLDGSPLYGVHISALRQQNEYEGDLVHKKTQELLDLAARLRKVQLEAERDTA